MPPIIIDATEMQKTTSNSYKQPYANILEDLEERDKSVANIIYQGWIMRKYKVDIIND